MTKQGERYKKLRAEGLCGHFGCGVPSPDSARCLKHTIELRLWNRKANGWQPRGPKGRGRPPLEVTLLGESEGV